MRLYPVKMQRSPDDILDELLVLRCQAGESEAFGLLICRWQRRLQRMVLRLTGNRDAEGDLVQEIWLAVVRGLPRLDDPARFRVWAYRIAANKCMDWVRRRRVGREAAPGLQRAAMAANDESRQHGSEQADEVNRLRVALRRLPGDLHTTISLHYLDGLGVSEIASVLNVPVGTVKSRLHTARAKLRKTLQESHHEGVG